MNKKQNHINDDILVKQLLGEATEAEQAAVNEWVSQSEANKKHYHQFKQIWDSSKEIAATSTVNEDAAWARFQERVTTEEETTPKQIPLTRRPNWMQVAASLVLLVSCGWLLSYFVLGTTTTLVADNQVITETLPDGTQVTINKGSSLSFNSRFRGDSRDVVLDGEAFFDVTPNKEKPFIITADAAKIKVVGTSFNVKSSAEATEVIVETGIVEVSKKTEMVKLLPKEKATVLKSQPAPIKADVDDALYSYYRSNELVCNNTPLWRLVDVLNQAYDVQVTIENPELKSLPITTTFKNLPIDSVLLTISETFNVQIDKQGKIITIK